MNGHEEVVSLLLEKGADVNIVNNVSYIFTQAVVAVSLKYPSITVCGFPPTPGSDKSLYRTLFYLIRKEWLPFLNAKISPFCVSWSRLARYAYALLLIGRIVVGNYFHKTVIWIPLPLSSRIVCPFYNLRNDFVVIILFSFLRRGHAMIIGMIYRPFTGSATTYHSPFSSLHVRI